MSNSTLYLGGYKLDRNKIRLRFPPESDDSEGYELDFIEPILNNIPNVKSDLGLEDGLIIVVLVLETGYEKHDLEEVIGKTQPSFPAGSMGVLTAGVWQAAYQKPKNNPPDENK